MPAQLCLFGEAETAVCVDVYIPNGIHLKGDFHKSILATPPLDGAAGGQVQWVSRARKRFQ